MYAFSRFLSYFSEVARSGSIRKAAEILHVAPSAISRQILQVERDLQFALFERLPSGLRPTAAGEIVLASFRRWQTEFEEMNNQIGDLADLRRGHVTIAVIDALTEGLVPAVIRSLQARYPDVTVTLRFFENKEVHDAIASCEADFGFMLNPPLSQDVLVKSTWDILVGIVTLPDHPLANRRSVRFDGCADLPMIMPNAPLSLHDRIRVLEVATGKALKPVVASDSIQMIKSLITGGAGVGILTSLDVMMEVEAGRLRFTPISELIKDPIPLSLCVGRKRQLSHAADRFLSAFADAMATRNLRTPRKAEREPRRVSRSAQKDGVR